MNVQRGLFRVWLVTAAVWIFGWLFYVWKTCEERYIPGGEPWKYQTFCRTSLFDDWTKQPQFFTAWDYLNIVASGLVVPVVTFTLGCACLWAVNGFRRQP